MFVLPKKPAVSLVGSVVIGRPVQEFRVFVEVIPSDIADIVCKPLKHVSHTRSAINDSVGYESIDDAIINSERIGLALRGVVKAENLFFVFGESVQFLRDALFRFLESRSIPYNSADLYAPVNSKESDRCEERETNPLAVVLCQVSNAESIGKAVRCEQHQAGKDADSCQISWSELQSVKEVLKCRQSSLLS